MNKIIEYINKIEFDMSIKFPPVYKRFLIEEIKDSEAYEITNKKHETLYLYNYSDLIERNETYDIQRVEPDYFLIGQDEDLGYFIYVGSDKESDTIFSIDLGALGAMEFSVEADDVYF
ncbi:TPA: SMI1/KNR4 family protein [Escherichia coli]|nr:SMI1/KNR4 family protein [Escherichia coli]HCP7952441.1 SMI1/KNR4 family protein [Escherichia coli]HCP9327555.1 SMI1/KNR4 family protein [Escherichia coli]